MTDLQKTLDEAFSCNGSALTDKHTLTNEQIRELWSIAWTKGWQYANDKTRNQNLIADRIKFYGSA